MHQMQPHGRPGLEHTLRALQLPDAVLKYITTFFAAATKTIQMHLKEPRVYFGSEVHGQ